MLGIEPAPLQKQPVLLNPEPSLQPRSSIFSTCVFCISKRRDFQRVATSLSCYIIWNTIHASDLLSVFFLFDLIDYRIITQLLPWWWKESRYTIWGQCNALLHRPELAEITCFLQVYMGLTDACAQVSLSFSCDPYMLYTWELPTVHVWMHLSF